MSIRIIDININDEYVQCDENFVGANGSHDDVVFRIKFDAMWDGLNKTCQFLNANHELPATNIVLTTDLLVHETTDTYLVPIPKEAKKYDGNMSFTIRGTKVENNEETRAVLCVSREFVVKESKWDSDGISGGDVTPTIADQLQQQITNILNNIDSIVTYTQQCYVYSQTSINAMNRSEYASTTALDSKTQAQNFKDLCEGYVEDAASYVAEIEDLSVTSETLAAGSSASVTKTKTETGVNLNFGIPKGADGVSFQAGNWATFSVKNGHLFVTYLVDDSSDPNPSFSIGQDGHLYMTIRS